MRADVLVFCFSGQMFLGLFIPVYKTQLSVSLLRSSSKLSEPGQCSDRVGRERLVG